jgi:exopolysaccharide production protein ExoY
MTSNINTSANLTMETAGENFSEHFSAIGHNPYFGGKKRVFDLVMALLALPVSLPLIAVLWLLVRADGGPGFFAQARVGRDGRHFQCLKLRTMAVDAEDRLRKMCESDPQIAREWHENQKLEHDPRITRIGEFLRKTSLDELPQLLNILLGDMSIVGPRPFMPEQQDLYTAAGGRAYFLMRPGITGSWQVFGRSATRFIDRVGYDQEYYAQASLGNDARLIMATVSVVMKMTGK